MSHVFECVQCSVPGYWEPSGLLNIKDGLYLSVTNRYWCTNDVCVRQTLILHTKSPWRLCSAQPKILQRVLTKSLIFHVHWHILHCRYRRRCSIASAIPAFSAYSVGTVFPAGISLHAVVSTWFCCQDSIESKSDFMVASVASTVTG